MNTFRNIFATVAMVLFVGLAVAPTLAMADEADAVDVFFASDFRILNVPYCISGDLIDPSCR